MKKLLLILSLFTCVFTYAQNEEDSSNIIIEQTEKEPEFRGGNAALNKFLSDNLKYPASVQEEGRQGTVWLSFVVNKDGSISDIEIIKGVDPALDKEAVRVIELMPNWIPGEQKGVKLRAIYAIPIKFRLSD